MWSQCRAAGRWSRLKRGWTEHWWSTHNRVIQDTLTSLASYCSGCLKYAALACRLRSICTSAIFWEICPATLYSLRCCTPSTVKKMLHHFGAVVTQEWNRLFVAVTFCTFILAFFTFDDCSKQLTGILSTAAFTALITEVKRGKNEFGNIC